MHNGTMHAHTLPSCLASSLWKTRSSCSSLHACACAWHVHGTCMACAWYVHGMG